MTTTEHAPSPTDHTEPPRYRMSAAQRNATDDRAHIVRVIAANPTYTAWLQDKAAALLRREAARLTERGQHAVAADLEHRARGYARGELGVW